MGEFDLIRRFFQRPAAAGVEVGVGDDCAVLVIETASTPAHWQAAARNLERARTRHGSSVPGLHAASVAAEYLASGELGDALASLAGACGMDADEWLTLTRDERGAEAS